MSCISSRLMVAAFAGYLVASVAHDEAVTWVAVAVSIAAVLVWSRRRGYGGRQGGQCGARCAERTEWSAGRAVPLSVDAATDGAECCLGSIIEEVR
ncbi:MAG: hypothetical protein ACYCZP_16960 [Acidimicrobiales bacterium]